MTSKFDELVAKLTEIFQIDKPELDFGIYKIINAKAGMIRDFLNHDLKQKVQQVLADKAGAGRKALEEKITKIEAELASLGVPPSSASPRPRRHTPPVRRRRNGPTLKSSSAK